MALALFSPRASAVCLSDADFDGYAPLPGMLGCPAVADCDDTDGTINPAELEYDNTDHDDNCNGRTAPLMGSWRRTSSRRRGCLPDRALQ